MRKYTRHLLALGLAALGVFIVAQTAQAWTPPTVPATPTGLQGEVTLTSGALVLRPYATFAADDVTPSVRGYNVFFTRANTGVTEITNFDDAKTGQIFVVCGGSDTNSSTISDASNFELAAGITLSSGTCITLTKKGSTFIELARTPGATAETSGTLTLGNGGTVTNAPNNAMCLGENSEDWCATFGANAVTFASTTSAAPTFTPAVTFTGGLTSADAINLSDGAIIDQSANNKVSITENSEDIEATFANNLITFDSTTGATFAFTPGVAFADAITLSDGATIDQSANNVVTFAENGENIEMTFAANKVTFGSTTSAVISIPVDILTITAADLVAGACTAGTIRIDTGGGTRELCICNAGGTAYDCWSATTANGPSD